MNSRIRDVIENDELSSLAVRFFVAVSLHEAVETTWEDWGHLAGVSRASAHRAAVELQRAGLIRRTTAVWALPGWVIP